MAQNCPTTVTHHLTTMMYTVSRSLSSCTCYMWIIKTRALDKMILIKENKIITILAPTLSLSHAVTLPWTTNTHAEVEMEPGWGGHSLKGANYWSWMSSPRHHHKLMIIHCINEINVRSSTVLGVQGRRKKTEAETRLCNFQSKKKI